MIFKVHEMDRYQTQNCIKIANGLANNFMNNLSKTWKIAHMEKKNTQQEVYKFLRHNRATPYCTTGKAHVEILFKRIFKAILPELNKFLMNQTYNKRTETETV